MKLSEIKNNKNILPILAVVSVIVAIITIILLFSNDSAKGTWELYSIEQGGNIIEGEELEAQYGGKVLYNLNDDGTLVVVQLGQEIQGEWSEEESSVYFHYSSSAKELVREKDTMILEQNGGVYTFIR